MIDINQELQDGMALHRAGALGEAVGRYHRVLAVDPDHVDARHLLGVARLRMGAVEEAFELVSSAFLSRPQTIGIGSNLENALTQMLIMSYEYIHNSRAIDAQRLVQKILILLPYRSSISFKYFPETLSLAGSLEQLIGDEELGRAYVQKSLKLDPSNWAANSALMLAAYREDDFESTAKYAANAVRGALETKSIDKDTITKIIPALSETQITKKTSEDLIVLGNLIKFGAPPHHIEKFRDIKFFNDKINLLIHACRTSEIDGLFMEFGVANGFTIRFIAKETDTTVYGFDSFEGLSEDWTAEFKAGAFKTDPPTFTENNIKLVKGWFSDTIPKFLEATDKKCAFLHVDCDTYNATRDILYGFSDRMMDGTVIVFDELYGYYGWEHHEHKAFHEFLSDTGFTFDYIGIANGTSTAIQAAVVLRRGIGA